MFNRAGFLSQRCVSKLVLSRILQMNNEKSPSCFHIWGFPGSIP